MEGEVGFREVWVRRILQKFVYLFSSWMHYRNRNYSMESDCVRTVSQV